MTDQQQTTTVGPTATEAFEVGRSRGDDHANYALSYGHPVSEAPTEIPEWYEAFEADFTTGWEVGIEEARERYEALG